MNPNLGASARTLQDWLLLGRGRGVETRVCLRAAGPLSKWLEEQSFAYRIVPMPWVGKTEILGWLKSAVGTEAWRPSRRPDVIYCYEHDLWPFVWPLAHMLRVPAICHFHFSIGRELAEWMFASRRKAPSHVIWTTKQQRADSADAVRGILPNERQTVVPLGIDLARFGNRAAEGRLLRSQLGFAEADVVVGCAAALRDRKRVDDFLNVVERLASRHGQVKGLFAGGVIQDECEYGERVAVRMRTLEAEGKLRWVGNVDDIEPVLQASDIQVSSSEYETFGMSVCEAMACGKAMAAYRGGSVAEVVGNAGLVVDTGDMDGLTAAVERLIVDAELRRSLGAAGRARVAEHFNPRQSFEQLLGIYESVLGERKLASRMQPAGQST